MVRAPRQGKHGSGGARVPWGCFSWLRSSGLQAGDLAVSPTPTHQPESPPCGIGGEDPGLLPPRLVLGCAPLAPHQGKGYGSLA